MSLEIKLEEGGKAPLRGSEGAAGYDIFANEDLIIDRDNRRLVSGGFSMKFPEGYYGRIAPRSGLAVKKSIDVGAGVVDVDYRGIVKVLLINNGRYSFKVEKGDRIAQLIIEKIITPPVVVVEELDDTQRGEGGFGSTGSK